LDTVLKTKLVLITEIIAPYRIPVFNALAQRPEVELHVVFLSENDPTLRQWQVYKNEIKFHYDVLPSSRLRLGRHNLLLNRGVRSTLSRSKPDVVIAGGYNYSACWSAAYWAKARSVPFLLWAESTIHDQRRNYALVELIKKRFLNMCTAFIVPGKSSLHYLQHLGIAEQRIITAPNAVDTNLFSNLAEAARRDEANRRAHSHLPAKYFLFAGRLIKEKGVFDLLDAYSQLGPEIRRDIGLVFVGGGSSRPELVDRASQIQPGKIQFPGFLHREELAQVYGLAEAFIFPTHSDPWGLVVNEAMACGLPIVSTTVAGCTPDLVEDGSNGFVVEPCDPSGLASAMNTLATNPEMWAAMGRKSRERIELYSPETWAEGMVKAVQSVVAKKCRKKNQAFNRPRNHVPD
jgi:glycosyltransferase involved in cell wall biosynthesis